MSGRHSAPRMASTTVCSSTSPARAECCPLVHPHLGPAPPPCLAGLPRLGLDAAGLQQSRTLVCAPIACPARAALSAAKGCSTAVHLPFAAPTVRVRHAAAVVRDVHTTHNQRVARLQPVQVPAVAHAEGQRGRRCRRRGGHRPQRPRRPAPLPRRGRRSSTPRLPRDLHAHQGLLFPPKGTPAGSPLLSGSAANPPCTACRP